MGDITEVTGMVLSAMPVGEYDRRIVLLTKERGKISAFAKGARRPNSPLLGVTRAFVFGTFMMYEGRTTYNLKQANITNYFEDVLLDYDAVCYACYFAELADYYGRENVDASSDINLLYVALKALLNKNIPNKLVRYIYELRLIAENGECPELFGCRECGSTEGVDAFSMSREGVLCVGCHGTAGDKIRISQSTLYTLQYIVSSPMEKLFKFTVSDEVLNELGRVVGVVCDKTFDKVMKSAEMIP